MLSSGQMLSADYELDATGLRCPMPLLKAKQAMQGLKPGQCLRVRATDPASKRDFRSWASQAGHVLLAGGEADGVFEFVLRKQ